jgi:glycosyltransferase involved in cell wall biosynthesis
MIHSRRILFLLKPWGIPSGGTATIYKHVEILIENGFNACVLLSKKPSVDFYESSAPVLIHNNVINYQPSDIFVIPEGFTDYLETLKNWPVRKVMFCQNQYFLPFSNDPLLGLKEFPVDNIIISSEAIRAFMKNVYGTDNFSLIPYFVDPKKFYPRKKIRQIAFMPRKLPFEAKFIQAAFKRVFKNYAEIPWVPIDGVNQLEAAEIMGSSEVFLSLSHLESFGLPPLEAMASGCLVAGFYGDGGREYMNMNNGWWVETGDWLACIRGLAAAFNLIDTGEEGLKNRYVEMELTVNRYSLENTKAKLLDFWSKEIETPF